ncbi:hypothetical protein A1O1_01626 [Capronia coronata CBS 617.96]|uniref:Ras guanine-nucleotide exchange protein Cdc25p n=1 Tax=Capronia coronata CBS 617.96 TaxID=1182541 RepID=W9Z3G7_9EURO|nr:uncharacterized protein A1O1_01626 [Capronia coronata CBS 617.96]EXJ96500.1 hypothetical protein A1O1_01626 [Capronia coronata CBS 617.96]
MRANHTSGIYVAPLGICEEEVDNVHGTMVDSPAHVANGPSPAIVLDPAGLDDASSPRSRFHNYLRALYPFQPAASHASTTVTLPLNTGDIILVHSVHVNGWADGTLLETGARGWLPTNYCEAYDYTAMRPLLRALTDFWDLVRCGTDLNLNLFLNQDYMRGLVAGVRALLERCGCLTRDSALVQHHDAIRRSRKTLLSDLASLVRSAKLLQQKVMVQLDYKDVDIRLDDMLLEAFRIVTRAVLFFDVWSEQTATVCFTPRQSQDVEGQARLEGLPSSQAISSTRRIAHPTGLIPVSTKAMEASALLQHDNRVSTEKPSTVRRQSSMTHRMSYARVLNEKHSSLISEYLHTCYDDFLTVLASFLGSHMQSRSSSELLSTTQNAVRSCRQLFAIVETVIERDYSTSRPLIQAKDAMYYAITELVHAAREVFQPVHSEDGDLVCPPEEAHNLLQAATACVSAAGRCVARTKATLEEIGDFELEGPGQILGRSSDGTNTPEPIHHETRPFAAPPASLSKVSAKEVAESVRERPRISISQGILTPPLSMNAMGSPSTGYGSAPPTPKDNTMPSSVRSSALASPSSLHQERPTASSDSNRPLAASGTLKPSARVHGGSVSSDSSFDRLRRRSYPSNLSTTSTRVTSFLGERIKSRAGSLTEYSNLKGYTVLGGDEEDAETEVLMNTFAQELVFNREGIVVGGTLNALVERLTTPDPVPDVSFINTIYLTFRLFARPEELAQALSYRFEYVGSHPKIASPVRLRVYNVLEGWMEFHWRHDFDDTALPVIVGFAREQLTPVLPMAGRRILELADKVSSATSPIAPSWAPVNGKANTSSAAYLDQNAPLPSPVISKSQLTALRAWKMGGSNIGILDFDPLEIARQFTLKASKTFCSILPQELLATEWTKRTSSLAVNVRAMSTLSTDVSNLVSDSVLQLDESKKRAAMIKHWVKIANKCLDLHNYDTVMAIVCALNSTNIKRLKRTWDSVPQKTKSVLGELLKVVGVAKNYSILRQRIQSHQPPCLPFIGVYLTDLTMVDTASPATRPLATDAGEISVINLDKHIKTAKIISDLQRFQIPYRLCEVPELQTWMQDQLIRVRSAGEKSFQMHYRRSLILEPREPNRSPNPEASHASKEREKFDFLHWTHLLQKEKSVPVSG